MSKVLEADGVMPIVRLRSVMVSSVGQRGKGTPSVQHGGRVTSSTEQEGRAMSST